MRMVNLFFPVLIAQASLVATLLTAAPKPSGKETSRWAILVGVDEYTELKKLRFAGNDQRALAERLIGVGFPKDQVFLLHDKAAEKKYIPTGRNIERQLDLILGLAEDGDLVIVGFSGHGVQLDGKSYLCPEDTQLDKLAETTIPLDRVYERLAKSKASLKLLMVDACRNDLLPAGRRSVALSRSIGEFAAAKEIPPEGILLLSSCAPGQASMEDEDFGHGVFMHFLIEGLKGKAVNTSGGVSLAGLYDFASLETKKYVARKYNDFQTPALKGEIHGPFEICSTVPKIEPPKPKQEPEITNSLGMKLKLIPAGKFMMGSERSAEEEFAFFRRYGKEIYGGKRMAIDDFNSEQPKHEVNITKPFYLSAYETTIGQFRLFLNETGYQTEGERDPTGSKGYDRKEGWIRGRQYSWRFLGYPQTDNHPIADMSWNDAMAFCAWLSKKDRCKYRLPTEAEWEYACRAGTTTRYFHGDDPDSLVQVANVADAMAEKEIPEWDYCLRSSDGECFAAAVGRFRPNAWGLYDMHGNVREWCLDSPRDYGKPASDDPKGPDDGEIRVIRGGSWSFGVAAARSCYREADYPSEHRNSIGFRVAKEAE